MTDARRAQPGWKGQAFDMDAPGSAALLWEQEREGTTWEKYKQVLHSAVSGITGGVTSMGKAAVTLSSELGGEVLERMYPDAPPQLLQAAQQDARGRMMAPLEAADEAVEEAVPSSGVPALEGSFAYDQLPAAFGQMGSILAGGAAGVAMKTPAFAVPMLMGSLQSAQAGFEDAKASGADDETAFTSFVLNAPVGALEAAIPAKMANRLGGIFARIDKESGGLFRRAVIEGLQEGSFEVAQSALSNVIAQNLYDEDRELLTEAATTEFGLGAITGSVLSALVSTAGIRLPKLGEAQDAAIEGSSPAPGASAVEPGVAQAADAAANDAGVVHGEKGPAAAPEGRSAPASGIADADAVPDQATVATAAEGQGADVQVGAATEPPVRTAPEKSTDEPTVPPTEPEVGETQEKGLAAKNESLARYRKEMGRSELPEAQRLPWDRDLEDAIGKGIPKKARALADEVLEKPRAFSSTETAGIAAALVDIKNDYRSVRAKLQKATDPAEISTLAAELNHAESEFDTISHAMKIAGTEAGRSLAARKLTLDDDMSILPVLAVAKAKKGSELSAKERKGLEKDVEAFEQVAQDLADAQLSQEISNAETALKTESDASLENITDNGLKFLLKKADDIMKRGCD